MVATTCGSGKVGRPRMRWTAFLAIVSVGSWMFASSAIADLQNGDFSSPLSVGWTDYSVVSIDDGVAILEEDENEWARLEQQFTIPAGSASLSFEYLPLFEQGGAESFSASLLDPVSFSPLIATDADPLDASEAYYFMHDRNSFTGADDVLTDSSYVTLTDAGGGWSRVTLNLGALAGAAVDAVLAFDFVPNFDDASLAGAIRLDNVLITLVPVPSAVVLAFLGLGVACGRLRGRS